MQIPDATIGNAIISIVGTLGAVVFAAAGLAVRKVIARMEQAHAARDQAITEALARVTEKQDQQALAMHRSELVWSEIRGEIKAMNGRIEAQERDLKLNREAHGTIHHRLDNQGERLVVAETKLGMQGAA